MTLSASMPARRGVAGVVAPLLLALALAACGGAGPGAGVVSLQDPSASPDPSAAPSASLDPEEAMEAFADCMREHGVDIQVAADPNGEGGSIRIGGPVSGSGPGKGGAAQPGGPAEQEDLAAADEACRHLLPANGRGDPSATMDPELADQLLEFSRCMREHGIDYPDPVFEGGGVSIALGGRDGEGGIDPSSDEFQAAQEACGEALPGGAPFVGGAPSEAKP